MIMTIRFGNYEEKTITIPATSMIGHYTFCLLNDEYWEKKGITTYKIDLYADGKIIQEWRHQLWTELIEINAENSF